MTHTSVPVAEPHAAPAALPPPVPAPPPEPLPYPVPPPQPMRARGRTKPPPDLSRRGRAVALVGAVWALAGAGYLTATVVSVDTLSLAHNASARSGEVGFPALATLLALITAIVLWRVRYPRPRAGAVLILAGVAFAALGTEAVARSDREFLLPALLVAVAFPALLIADGGCLVAAAHSREALLGGVAAVIALTGILAVTLFRDHADEAALALGFRHDWTQVTAVDQVFLDGANTWGVKPWRQDEPTALFLLDPATRQFTKTAERSTGWPPTVLGRDGSGATWIASSDRADPFQPVFETYRDGQLTPVAVPAGGLPALDAVALDGPRNRLFGLRSDFNLPSTLILERYENGTWTSAATPVVTPGRATSVDLAVDPAGTVWVWTEANPALILRYDGTAWTDVPLPFDLETTTDLAHLPPTMDPFRAFVTDANGAIWIYDRDGNQLAGIDETGALGLRPLPAGCTPLGFDPEGRVWCGRDEGLVIVAPDGAVLYESHDHDVHPFRPLSAAIGRDRAWLLVERHEALQLLAFDYRDAMTPSEGFWPGNTRL